MYGPSPASIIEKFSRAPPDNTFRKLRNCGELPLLKTLDNTCWRVCGSLIGTGMWARIRNTRRIPSTAKIRLRISCAFRERAITFQFNLFPPLWMISNTYALQYTARLWQLPTIAVKTTFWLLWLRGGWIYHLRGLDDRFAARSLRCHLPFRRLRLHWRWRPGGER